MRASGCPPASRPNTGRPELRFARAWGRSVEVDGQQVSQEHRVADRDVVELHW